MRLSLSSALPALRSATSALLHRSAAPETTPSPGGIVSGSCVRSPSRFSLSKIWQGLTGRTSPVASASRLSLLAASALALAACNQGGGGGGGSGGGGGGGGGGTVPYTPPNVYISVDEIGFYPDVSWAEPGAWVYFSNDACDDFDGDVWCDWDEELDVYVDGETTPSSTIYDAFTTDWMFWGDEVGVKLPYSLRSGDSYDLYAGYAYTYNLDGSLGGPTAGSAASVLHID